MPVLDPLAQAEPATEILLETFVCLRTRREFALRKVLRCLTVDRAQRWRRLILQAIADGEPKFGCPACKRPLSLVLQLPNRFHFRHAEKFTKCPLQDDRRRAVYRKDVDYAGAAESPEHKQLKRKLIECLTRDPDFSDIDTGRLFSGSRSGWRQPDVNAEWRNQRLAFELQLSSTYLEELVERRIIYRERSVPMIWLMADFDPHEVNLPQADTVALLGGLALCLDDPAIAASLEAKALRLSAFQFVTHDRAWRQIIVGMDNLVLSPDDATIILPQPPIPAPEPPPDRTLETRRLLEDLVNTKSLDAMAIERSSMWRELLSYHPDLRREFVKEGWDGYPDAWCVSLAAAVMMGLSGRVHGYRMERLQQPADVFAENSYEIFATLVRVLRHFGLEDCLYETAGGENLRRKADAIRNAWPTAPQKKFRTSSAARELVARAWPEMRLHIVHPPKHTQ